MIGLSGMSAVASLAGIHTISKNPAESGLQSKKLKIIVVGAHPGDPECGCGGTIALFTAAGHEVVAAYLTRGEAGVQGKSYEEAGKIRTDEALKECKIIKCRAEFFGQIDGNCEIKENSYAQVNDFIKKENPDLVFTHWPIVSHRDHRICSILAYDA